MAPTQLSVAFLLMRGIMASGSVDKEVHNGGVEVVLSVDADFIDPRKIFRNSPCIRVPHHAW
jgi:hypothetical protein